MIRFVSINSRIHCTFCFFSRNILPFLDRAAEARLQEYSKTNYGELVKALATELANESKQLHSRQVASIYLKNTIYGKSSAVIRENQDRWKRLDAAIRSQVKELVLQAMRSDQERVPHFSAVAAAEIAAVELPFNEWPAFIPTMMENVQKGTNAVKIASLEALGFTSDRIANLEGVVPGTPDLASSTVDSMLTTIVDAVQPANPKEMRFAALTALKNSLVFVRKNMEVKPERDFIMGAICEAAKAGDSAVRKLAFECMISLAELYYDKLNDFMTSFYDLTTTAIRNDADEGVKIAAIEFWSSVAESEQVLLAEERDAQEAGIPLDRPACPKFVQAVMQHIIPLLLQLLTQFDENADEDEFNIQSAASFCLSGISQTVSGAVLGCVMPFVQEEIRSPNWRYRNAAILAFSAVLEGQETNDVAQYAVQSIPVLLGLFDDQESVHVRDSAVYCVNQIAKYHYFAFRDHVDTVHSTIKALIDKLQAESRIASRAASAIYSIAHSEKTPKPPESNVLSAPMLPLMRALLEASDRPDADESNLRIVAMSAAAELVQGGALDVHNIFVELLPAIIGRFESSMSMQVVSSEDSEKKEQLLGLLSGLIQVLFQRMQKQEVSVQADRIMDLLLKGLHVRNAVCHEEIFYAVGAIANVMEDEFAKYLQAFMPLLLAGLGNFQAETLCKASIGVVADICGAVGAMIQPYCDQIMTILMNCLKDGSVHRDIKPVVISCFGDIAMAIGGAYEPYLQGSMMLLMQAAGQRAPDDDEELIDFINVLRLSILEAYSAIILGLDDGKMVHLFTPMLPGIFQFLQFLSAPESNKDEDVLNKAVSLLGDIAQHFGPHDQVKQQLTQPFVAHLVQEALSLPDDSMQENAAWARSIIQAAVQG